MNRSRSADPSKAPPTSRSTLENPLPDTAQRRNFTPLAVFSISLLIGATAFFLAYKLGWNNLYGDGQAHVGIARKLVDAPPGATLWDRYVQLGSPWLPLQHILMLPFVWFDPWWRNGVAGSLVSVAAFAVGATLLFQLARLEFEENKEHPAARFAPWLAWLVFVANPPLLYAQATPLTEPVFLATFIGSVFFLRKWRTDQKPATLAWAGAWATLVTLARYEGWALLPFCGLYVLLASGRPLRDRWRDALVWGICAAVGPVYWLWHNHAIFGNALEFLNGINSARGYFARHSDELSYTNFVIGRPHFAALILLVTIAICATPTTLTLGLLGLATASFKRISTHIRERSFIPHPSSFILLAVPPLFTGYSLYTGNIQIYPFFLNNRYGLPALPLLALAIPVLCLRLSESFADKGNRRIVCAVFAALTLGQSAWWLRDGFRQLSVFQEGYRVQSFRSVREMKALGEFLKSIKIKSDVVMHTGELAQVIADGDLRYGQLVHEGTKPWHELEKTVPPTVEYIVYREGDAVSEILKKNPPWLGGFEMIWNVGVPKLVVLKRRNGV